ncbi:MAG: phosphate acyltransferase PlsX [Chloroflexota bacterium]
MTNQASEQLVPIALDAMGGDHGPAETVAGAVEAAQRGGVAVALVGDEQALKTELERHDVGKLPLQIIPSEGVVAEGEAPARAFRSKPKASIFVATHLAQSGKASAVVSMGSTGATIAAATVLFGVFDGIDRGALGGPMNGLSPHTIVIDLGTNIDCKPQQIADFAALGTVLSRVVYRVESPRVALLSVGAEEGKGNNQIKAATDLLKASGLNFIGNIEAYDIPFDRADVVACDGFAGNIVMKLTEGIGDSLVSDVRRQMAGQVSEEVLDSLCSRIHSITNQAETHGGGPIFGVNGVSIVGHGRAQAGAIANAIHTARRAVLADFVEEARAELGRIRQNIHG